jgi:hypothetical protein
MYLFWNISPRQLYYNRKERNYETLPACLSERQRQPLAPAVKMGTAKPAFEQQPAQSI